MLVRLLPIALLWSAGAYAQASADPTTLRLAGVQHAQQGRHREAIQTLEIAKAMAPADVDILLALSRAHFWAGENDLAAGVLAEARALQPSNPEVLVLRTQLRRARSGESRRRLSAVIGRSDLRQGSSTSQWSDVAISARQTLTSGRAVTLTVDREDRAGVSDLRISGQIEAKLAPSLHGSISASATPRADFREIWKLDAALIAHLSSDIALSLGARQSRYHQASVTVIQPGIALSAFRGKAEFEAKALALRDETRRLRFGHELRIGSTIAGEASLRAGLARYPETEGGITKRVRSLAIGGAYPVSERISIFASVERDVREDDYRRRRGALALSWRL